MTITRYLLSFAMLLSLTAAAPHDPFAEYVGRECAALHDNAVPNLSYIAVDGDTGTLVLRCAKHEYSPEWIVK